MLTLYLTLINITKNYLTLSKVVKKLVFSDELNEQQKRASDFLKKYIKSLL